MDWSVNNSFNTYKDMQPETMMDVSLIHYIDLIDVGLGSSEKANGVPAVKPRNKTMTSDYLKYFETTLDGKTRRCKFCGQSYSIATATVREFVQELNASVDISEDFIQLTTAYQEGNWQFPLDASASGSGNYHMLDLVYETWKSMDAVVRKNEEMLGSGMLLNAAEKNVVNIVHNYLEPIYKVISEICVNNPRTIGMVIVYMDHIFDTIATRQTLDWLKNGDEDMAKMLRSYNNQVCNTFVYMTTILDPRIECELLPESLNSEIYLEEAGAHLTRNYYTSHFLSVTSGYSAQDIEDEVLILQRKLLERSEEQA